MSTVVDKIDFEQVVTPIGIWNVESRRCELVRVSVNQQKVQGSGTGLSKAAHELKEYSSGRLRNFSVPVYLEGTEFQQKVWTETARIPYGETRTYAEIAKAIGHPKAVRAVGTALGANPVPIVIPCHRVVPTSGGIGKYALGTAVKQALLTLETL